MAPVAHAADAPRPGDDFYGYVNGPWLAATKLPAGRASYDTGAQLREAAQAKVRALVRAAADGSIVEATAANRTLARQIGDTFASQADGAAIEAAGLAPLGPQLAAVAAIRDRHALATALGRSLALDDGTDTETDSLFGLWVHQGFHDGQRYAAHLMQGGLGLPDRDSYLDPAAAELRDRYRAHAAAMFRAAGLADTDARAGRVLALEIEIARTHASRADTDDVFKTDNAWSRADFTTKAPGLDWPAFFQAAGLAEPQSFVVWQPGAFAGAAELVAHQPLAAWKDYLTLRLLEREAPALPRAIAEEHLALAAGLPAQRPALDRDQQAFAAVDATLGEGVGRLYAERYFPPAAKAAAEAMVANIRVACAERLVHIAWMSPATREKALAKLAAVRIGLGYPDHWTDVSGLVVVRGQALANRQRAERFAYRAALARLGRSIDTADWPIRPQTANATIDFSPNAYEFGAGLFQPPFFDPDGDPAANYGSAGAGLAHELWHSFDALGRIWDDQGRLGAWIPPADVAAYDAAAAPLARQLDGDCPKPDVCVHGHQVLDESIGDLIGLALAHDAYVRSLGGKPDAVKNGLTGDQRFFRAYAARWRRLQTDEALARQVATDTHAPGPSRAAAVRNLDAWYEAFAVKPGDKLYVPPDQRVRLP